ncbi:HAD family phosphatase [Deinococcus sp. KNUC1210]|uniref:HAD family hydrolase n=1 Tax=Deinococcus sp. KNUC1210 TaxID=2917691 RepID=UPI001EF03500|nr:HAD family phosphatase [Deinococcus sp. KNUC1210]ULH14909.1 HAD family phosphatase [Deinococcus sp. KNUC1210]
MTLTPDTSQFPRAVLFDMDGVLTDNNHFHRAAWKELALELLALDLSEDDLNHKVDGGRNPEIIERLTGAPPTPELAERFHVAKEQRYRELALGQLRAVAGLKDYLEALTSRGIPAVIVTSADLVNTEFALEALGIARYFQGRILGEDVQRGKPDPQPYTMGAALLGLNAADCLAHEDAVNGVRSAAGAGCRVVALTTTQNAETLLAAGAALAVPDFTGWAGWLGV